MNAGLWRLMRPHQWIKNAFVFIGILYGHVWHQSTLVFQVCLAFAAFCLVSSAVYILNDVVDLEQDRHHPEKCRRPLACGEVSLGAAAMLAVLLAVIGLLTAYTSAPTVLAILIGYVFLNLAYSLRLKHAIILDVFSIAAGFMLRILAGTLGVGIAPSQWLLLCGLMATLFFGFAKRRAELIALSDDGAAHRKVLTDYNPVLLDKMIGIVATCLVMSYSLYTMSPETIRLHQTPNLIYTVPLVVYGVFRYTYRLHQGMGGGDPSRDLLNDRHLQTVFAVWLAVTLWLIA